MTDASALGLIAERPHEERRRRSGAVNAAVDLYLSDGGAGNDQPVLVVSGGRSSVATALESDGWSITRHVLRAGDDGAWQSEGTGLAGCVIDGVLTPLEKPAELLSHAYSVLRPGGRLVVVLADSDRQNRSGRLGGRGLGRRAGFSGESLPALLFREGFERPRFHAQGTTTVVTAYRSELPPPYQRPQRLSVVMPVFNERQTFRKAMDALLGKSIPGMEIEFIIVESNSTDGTREDVLEYSDNPSVRLILEERPQGKGHAVRRGLAEVQGDFVIIQDADLEYNIDDYDSLLEPLRQFEVGFVLGMRTSPDGSWGMRQFGERNVVSRIMNLGHLFFLTLFNVVYGQRLHDPFTMYKVMRRDCLYGLTFECDRFDFDWELTGKLVRAGYTPKELPASYESRSFTDGKKVSFFGDPLTWVVACFKYRFVRLYR
jgi:hypothetical protein